MSGMEPMMIMSIMSAVGTGISVLDSIGQGIQQKAAAREQRRIADYNRQLAERQAENLEQTAGQERASAQRSAINQRRQTAAAMSRAQAVAGASGAGALDPTIVNILGDIGFEGDYREGVAGFEGESRGQALEYEAVIARATGDSNLAAGYAGAANTRAAASRSLTKAATTAFSGASSLYDKYAQSPPPGRYRPPPGPHTNTSFYG